MQEIGEQINESGVTGRLVGIFQFALETGFADFAGFFKARTNLGRQVISLQCLVGTLDQGQ